MSRGERRRPSSADRIAAIADRYELPASAAGRLGLLLERVTEDPFAPTNLLEPAKAIDDHLADSLVALELEQTRSAATIADLGAGAGFPGLPLAIALPQAEVVLVDSSARKCAFIEGVADACRITNTTVVHARAEAWPDGLGRFDLVTARALAPLGVVAEYAAPLLRVGGALLVWRGKRDTEAEAVATRATSLLGLAVREPQQVHPYDGANHRHLQLMFKVSPTPDGFPRRPGMARKRPLGGRQATRP
jgi:16S rRNA (guanine527-N7)-methyltransferase